MPSNKDRLRANPLSLANMVDRAIGDAEPEVVEREVVVYQDNPNAIQRHDDGTMTYKRFVMTSVGLTVPEDATSDELVDLGTVIHGLHSSIQWIVGDLMNSMRRIWGDSYQNVAAELGYEVKTVQEWASICKKVSIRMEGLSFGHHQLVAPLEAELQQKWLAWAEQQQISVSGLRKAIADSKKSLPGQSKFVFSAATTENEHFSYVHLTRIRNVINGKQTLTTEQILEDAIKLKEFAESVIRDMGGE